MYSEQGVEQNLYYWSFVQFKCRIFGEPHLWLHKTAETFRSEAAASRVMIDYLREVSHVD